MLLDHLCKWQLVRDYFERVWVVLGEWRVGGALFGGGGGGGGLFLGGGGVRGKIFWVGLSPGGCTV